MRHDLGVVVGQLRQKQVGVVAERVVTQEDALVGVQALVLYIQLSDVPHKQVQAVMLCLGAVIQLQRKYALEQLVREEAGQHHKGHSTLFEIVEERFDRFGGVDAHVEEVQPDKHLNLRRVLVLPLETCIHEI